MTGLLRGLGAVRKTCPASIVKSILREQAAETRPPSTPGFQRFFAEQPRSGANPATEANQGALPTWGYAAIGAAAGGAYWYYKRHQKHQIETQPHGLTGDTYKRSDPISVPAASAAAQPVPLPPFEAVDAVTGKPVSLDDLKDDFAVMGLGSGANAAAAKKALVRIQEVIEGVDDKTNMQYTWAIFVDEDPLADGAGKGMSKLVGDFTEEQRKSKKGKTELRLKALTGEAVLKIKEAVEKFTHKLKGEGKSAPPPGGDDGGVIYFIDPEGDLILEFDEGAIPDDIASKMAEEIINYKRQNPSWKGPKAVKGRVA